MRNIGLYIGFSLMPLMCFYGDYNRHQKQLIFNKKIYRLIKNYDLK